MAAGHVLVLVLILMIFESGYARKSAEAGVVQRRVVSDLVSEILQEMLGIVPQQVAPLYFGRSGRKRCGTPENSLAFSLLNPIRRNLTK